MSLHAISGNKVVDVIHVLIGKFKHVWQVVHFDGAF